MATPSLTRTVDEQAAHVQTRWSLNGRGCVKTPCETRCRQRRPRRTRCTRFISGRRGFDTPENGPQSSFYTASAMTSRSGSWANFPRSGHSPGRSAMLTKPKVSIQSCTKHVTCAGVRRGSPFRRHGRGSSCIAGGRKIVATFNFWRVEMGLSSPRCNRIAFGRVWIGALAATGVLSFASIAAAATINGQVLGGSAPIANSTVTLFAASAGAPRQLGQVRTGTDGRFVLNAPSGVGNDTTYYLVANGGKSWQWCNDLLRYGQARPRAFERREGLLRVGLRPSSDGLRASKSRLYDDRNLASRSAGRPAVAASVLQRRTTGAWPAPMAGSILAR